MEIKQFRVGNKYKDFLKHNCEAEFLEGQTYAGKTTVGQVKFILKCIASPKMLHGVAGQNVGIVEKNIINAEMGLKEIFGDNLTYWSNGHSGIKLPHIEVKTSKGNKIIFVFGYDDITKWKNALGGQLGCLMIDEVNIANIDFVREAFMRADYKLCTLNPDNPNLEIYSEYINKSRPLEKWANETPEEMMSQLKSQKANEEWTHWYFTMDDNISASEEKKRMIRESVPVGTKIYKNKILGLRGRSEGLVFDKFERKDKVVEINDFRWLPNESVYRIVVGLDSGINADATAAIPMLITSAGRILYMPSFYYVPKVGTNASSQQARLLEMWFDKWFIKFNVYNPGIVEIIGDSAALTQALILELNLTTKYKAVPVPKKDIQADTTRAIATTEKDNFLIINAGDIDPLTMKKRGDVDMFIIELENQVWDKKKGNVPEDGNDHCIDAFKYGTYDIYYGGVY